MYTHYFSVAAIGLLLIGPATAADAPLPVPAQRIDLERYAGDWFVHGCIPLRIPFFSDADARNYTEHYDLLSPDTIRMTSAFETGPGDETKRRSFSFDGDVVDEALKATWKIWLMWPIGAKYSIVYIDESYTTTIVASANRRLAWIMSREPQMNDAQYNELIAFLQQAGFDPAKFRRVPQEQNRVAQIQ